MIEVGNKSSVALVVHQHAAAIRRSYPDDGDRFAQHVSDLADGAERFQQAVDTLEKDGWYSPRGLPGAVKAEAEKWRAALVQFRKNFIDPLTSQETRLLAEASVPKPLTPEDKVLQFLRHQSLRDHMARIDDPMDRVILLMKAADRGDRDFIDSVAEAPESFRLVDPQDISKVRQKMATAASPELTRITTLRDAYEQVAAVASAELRGVLERFRIELPKGW